MKTRIIPIFISLICCVLLLSSCSETENKKPDINEAVWDLYPNLPFTELIGKALDSEQAFLKSAEVEASTSHSLSQGWIQPERCTFDGNISDKSNAPYTLTMNISSKSTEGEKEITDSITSYIFLEYNADENAFTVCASFVWSVKTNGTYETITLSTLPGQLAENELITLLQNNAFENLPEKSIVPEDAKIETVTRRYNHKPIDEKQMYLSEFPDTTLYDILSRFDDAYGGIMQSSGVVTDEANNEYECVSFDVTSEYDWKKSKNLDEFTDGSDNYQPYTYSAVYTADGKDGLSLTATLDVFAEIEPKHGVLKLRESVFTIERAGKTLFFDTHDEQETIILLGTIMQYYPEDALVTPSPEELGEEAAADADAQPDI